MSHEREHLRSTPERSSLASALLSALEARIFVTPQLRRLVAALPLGPSDDRTGQLEAVAGLVVLNTWICCSSRALDILKEIDAATGDALSLSPRNTTIELAGEAAIDRVRGEVAKLAMKLGFSPAHRTRVAAAASELAQAAARRSGTRLELEHCQKRRGLLARATGLRSTDELGAVQAAADDFATRLNGGAYEVQAVFYSDPDATTQSCGSGHWPLAPKPGPVNHRPSSGRVPATREHHDRLADR
jgi:hypothetical protein